MSRITPGLSPLELYSILGYSSVPTMLDLPQYLSSSTVISRSPLSLRKHHSPRRSFTPLGPLTFSTTLRRSESSLILVKRPLDASYVYPGDPRSSNTLCSSRQFDPSYLGSWCDRRTLVNHGIYGHECNPFYFSYDSQVSLRPAGNRLRCQSKPNSRFLAISGSSALHHRDSRN